MGAWCFIGEVQEKYQFQFDIKFKMNSQGSSCETRGLLDYNRIPKFPLENIYEKL